VSNKALIDLTSISSEGSDTVCALDKLHNLKLSADSHATVIRQLIVHLDMAAVK